MELNWKKNVEPATKISALGLAMPLSNTFGPLVFSTSAPEGLLKVPRGTQIRPHSIVTAICRPQTNPIGTAAGSAFSPVDSNHSKLHPKQLSDRLASVFPLEENGREDSEIASALGKLSLSTTMASGRTHQRSAPLPERTAKEKEQRIILTTKSQTWRHGTSGYKRLSSYPGTLSNVRRATARQCRAPTTDFPTEINTAPIAKKPRHIRHPEPQIQHREQPLPYGEQSSSSIMGWRFPGERKAATFCLDEAQASPPLISMKSSKGDD